MSSTRKKVIVRKLDRDTAAGYVGSQFIADGKLELLNTAGNVVTIALSEIKGVYFVREFSEPESLTRKTFTSRPRAEGLWVRLHFRDNEIIEGLMPNDLVQEGSGRFLDHPARHAFEHAADFRATLGAGRDERDRRHRGEEDATRPPAGRHASGSDVRVILTNVIRQYACAEAL